MVTCKSLCFISVFSFNAEVGVILGGSTCALILVLLTLGGEALEQWQQKGGTLMLQKAESHYSMVKGEESWPAQVQDKRHPRDEPGPGTAGPTLTVLADRC